MNMDEIQKLMAKLMIDACMVPYEVWETSAPTACVTADALNDAREALRRKIGAKHNPPPAAYAINGLDFDEVVDAASQAGCTIEGYETPFELDGWQYFVIENTPLGIRETPLFVIGTIERGTVAAIPQSMFTWSRDVHITPQEDEHYD